MKLSKLCLVMLIGMVFCSAALNSADYYSSDADSEFGEANHIYLINREILYADGTPSHSYHFFSGDGRWNELWHDLVDTDNGDFADLGAPHSFIVRLRDDFVDQGAIYGYDIVDNVLRYDVHSSHLIPFESIREFQLPLEDPIYGNLRAKIEEHSGPIFDNYVLIEVE